MQYTKSQKVTCFSSFLYHFLLFIDLLFSQLILINYSIYLIIFIKHDCFFRFVNFDYVLCMAVVVGFV